MAVSWEFFAGRRSVTLREILEAEKITTYDELVLKLKKMGVRAPLRSQVSWMFNEKADKIHIPSDPSMSMEEMMEARKKITDIIMEDDPEALIPQMKLDPPTGGIKPVGNPVGPGMEEMMEARKKITEEITEEKKPKKAPQRRKKKVRRTTKTSS